jgi:hypothetical protein
MSAIHIRQIRSTIQEKYIPHIDISDCSKNNLAEKDKENIQVSRGQAALAIAYLCNIEPKEAANSVTDGFHDNGIDAIYFDQKTRNLYILQSKWHEEGRSTICQGDIQKFLTGFNNLINARWERFNNCKIAARKDEIESALNDASSRIVLVVVHTGTQNLSIEVDRDIQDKLNELNDPVDIVSLQVFNQAILHSIVSDGIKGTPINLEVALFDWGQIREPYRGYYGQISAEDVASWKNQHHHRLFAPNLRVFLGATDVNQNMVETLTQDPEKFWYFNNGITALCRSIEKKILGGQSRDTGIFECKDLTIVNGAQTVGAISAAIDKNPGQASKARVTIRLISLDECPPEFDKDVTRYTNTQNRIESRDFVALDPNQARIRSELLIDGIEYVYKSGETPSSRNKGFDLTEATVALACQYSDVSFAVDAKGAIGRLWADIEAAPYKSLFNPSLTGPRLWHLVQITRIVESVLEPIRQEESGRKRLLAMQGNRLCIHAVFSRLSEEQTSVEISIDEVMEVLHTTTQEIFDLLYSIIEEHYPENYLGSLFKNKTKSQDVMKRFKDQFDSSSKVQ